MDTLRSEGDAEADDVFTPERLRAQQQQIARRIEHVGRPARVISFPGRIVRRTMPASAAARRRRAGSPPPPPPGCSSASRVGAVLRPGGTRSAPRRRSCRAATAPASRRSPTPARTAPRADVDRDDDAFLSELEIGARPARTRASCMASTR